LSGKLSVREIEEVKMDWIKSNLERGLPVPEPRTHKYSGQIRLRILPPLHKVLAYRAETEGVSLNQYMVTALARVAGVIIEAPPTKKKGFPTGKRG
jgi:predicted HicB family RNase H-like nuclease